MSYYDTQRISTPILIIFRMSGMKMNKEDYKSARRYIGSNIDHIAPTEVIQNDKQDAYFLI